MFTSTDAPDSGTAGMTACTGAVSAAGSVIGSSPTYGVIAGIGTVRYAEAPARGIIAATAAMLISTAPTGGADTNAADVCRWAAVSIGGSSIGSSATCGIAATSAGEL